MGRWRCSVIRSNPVTPSQIHCYQDRNCLHVSALPRGSGQSTEASGSSENTIEGDVGKEEVSVVPVIGRDCLLKQQRYELGKMISHGGFGQVFVARDTTQHGQ